MSNVTVFICLIIDLIIQKIQEDKL
jgi:hypothetical protein